MTASWPRPVRIDGVRVGQLTVGGTPELTAGNANSGIGNYAESGSPLANADDGLEVRTPVKAGMRQVIATIVKADNILVEGLALLAAGCILRAHAPAAVADAFITTRLSGSFRHTWGQGLERADARAIIDRALPAGA